MLGPLARAGADGDQVVARAIGATLGDARWRVVWPPAAGARPGNDASVVLDARRGPALPCALFLGDLGEAPQDAAARVGRASGAVDVVKVAHHGSADQSARLYERLARDGRR